MNRFEMARLLAKIQLGDRRQVTDLVVTDWLETIGHLTYQDAYMAVVAHRRDSTDYLQAAHINQRVRKANPQQAVTMSPEITDCGEGKHRWLDGGTCNFCETRRREDDR